jgi:hypothetical protein
VHPLALLLPEFLAGYTEVSIDFYGSDAMVNLIGEGFGGQGGDADSAFVVCN